MEEREIMRKRLLKLTSMVLAGTMLVSMATGCGSSNTTTETGEAAATTETTDEVTASSTEETSTGGELPVYGDKLVWDGNVPVNNGEDVSLLVYAPSGTIGDYYVEWANNYMQLRPNVKIDIQLQTFWKPRMEQHRICSQHIMDGIRQLLILVVCRGHRTGLT